MKLQLLLAFVGLLLLGAFLAVFNRRVDYEVWKQSAQYNIGTTNDLYDLRNSYLTAKDDDAKMTLKITFKGRAQAYGVDKLPSDLKAFYYGGN